MKTEDNKQDINEKFDILMDKARKEYPDIDDFIETYNNMTAQTKDFNDYLNLSYQSSLETSNNQITL